MHFSSDSFCLKLSLGMHAIWANLVPLISEETPLKSEAVLIKYLDQKHFGIFDQKHFGILLTYIFVFLVFLTLGVSSISLVHKTLN